jgi:hypothetical protein
MSSLASYRTLAALAERLATAAAKPVRRLLTSMAATATLIWVGTNVVGAQVSPPPGMGATSPLGTGSSGSERNSSWRDRAQSWWVESAVVRWHDGLQQWHGGTPLDFRRRRLDIEFERLQLRHSWQFRG